VAESGLVAYLCLIMLNYLQLVELDALVMLVA